MDVKKQPGSVSRHQVSAEDLALINKLSKSALAPEQVYTFAVRLCDNEVDRDFERFDLKALKTLSHLFIGKSGIFDHEWKSEGQTARLYKTELCPGEGTTEAGESAFFLKGYAYMLRSEKNKDLIDEIEAGIKKEVSIGCSVSRSSCSICGESNCGHQRGHRYNGKLCYFTLHNPVDAYEWSFVAVPAQRKAGVIKAFGKEGNTGLKALLASHPGYLEHLETLEKEAELGRAYLTGLRKEVIRLAGTADEHLDLKVFAGVTEKLEEAELLELKRAYQHRLDEKYPLPSQLHTKSIAPNAADEDGVYLI